MTEEKKLVSVQHEVKTMTYTFIVKVVRPADTANLITCPYCDKGFRRVNGRHVGSVKLGMIPDTPCERIFAAHVGNATEHNKKPWLAYVDGAPLENANGVPLRYAKADIAYQAAKKWSPRRWHD